MGRDGEFTALGICILTFIQGWRGKRHDVRFPRAPSIYLGTGDIHWQYPSGGCLVCFDSIGFTAARSSTMGFCPLPVKGGLLGGRWPGRLDRRGPAPPPPLTEREPGAYRRSVCVLGSFVSVRIITTKIPPTFMRNADYPLFYFCFPLPAVYFRFRNACRWHERERERARKRKIGHIEGPAGQVRREVKGRGVVIPAKHTRAKHIIWKESALRIEIGTRHGPRAAHGVARLIQRLVCIVRSQHHAARPLGIPKLRWRRP